MLELLAAAVLVEPVVVLEHKSDLFRGAPFNEREEIQVDYIAAGVTITAGKKNRWEIDLLQGVKSVERGKFEPGTSMTVRWYLRRGK